MGYISWDPQDLCHEIRLIICDKMMYALGKGIGMVSEKLDFL